MFLKGLLPAVALCLLVVSAIQDSPSIINKNRIFGNFINGIEANGQLSTPNDTPEFNISRDSYLKHRVYILGSGLNLKHTDFRQPYVKVKGKNIYNRHRGTRWQDKMMDVIFHNDFNGLGVTAASACCSKSLKSFPYQSIDLCSIKVFSFEGKTDVTAIIRGLNYIKKDIKRNNVKSSTVIYAAPDEISHWLLVPLIKSFILKFVKKVSKRNDHDTLVIFPTGDFNFNIAKTTNRRAFRELSASDHVVTVGARDQRFDGFKKLTSSNFGDLEYVNVYAPGHDLSVWDRNDIILRDQPRNRKQEKVLTQQGSTVASGFLGGIAAGIFLDPQCKYVEAVDVKQKLIELYSSGEIGG